MQNPFPQKEQWFWIVAAVLLAAGITWTVANKQITANKETLVMIKKVDSSLMMANLLLIQSNDKLSAKGHENLKRPEISEKAKIWSPRIDSAITLANGVFTEIEALKTKLKIEAGLRLENGVEVFNEDDNAAPGRLMIEKGEGKILEEVLLDFSNQLIGIVPEEMQRKVELPLMPIAAVLYKSNFEKNGRSLFWFKNISTVAALSFLSKLENDILRSGNMIADYCGVFCTSNIIIDERFEILASQNSTYLLPGDILEVTAGIGAFTSYIRPQITINGIKVEVNDYCFARYNLKVSNRDGKVPVVISYKDPNTGREITKSKFLHYKVVHPK